MKYFFDLYLFTSGGALAALFLGLVVKELWRRKLPGFLTSKVRQEAALMDPRQLIAAGSEDILSRH